MTSIHENFVRLVVKSLGENPECGVCLEGMNKDNIEVMNCSHAVCNNCLPRLLRSRINACCPFCRHPLKEKKANVKELKRQIQFFKTLYEDEIEKTRTLENVIEEHLRNNTEEYVPSDPADMMFGLTPSQEDIISISGSSSSDQHDLDSVFIELQAESETQVPTETQAPAPIRQRRARRPLSEIHCGRCGVLGHYASNRRMCNMHPSRMHPVDN